MNDRPAGATTQNLTAAGSGAFAGFWMGGYEGADHINFSGVALDMARSSGHLDRLDEDHRNAAAAGLRCVRESIGWRLAEAPGGAIDLSRALRIAASARRHGLQVLWTLMHYGLPSDLCLHDDALIPRFARFAAEVARVLGPLTEQAPVYTPVNEIGYLAWAASQPFLMQPPNNTVGADGSFAAPESSRISGYGVKRRLARAAMAAMAAVRQVDPRARFLHVEPVVHVVTPRGQPELAPLAEQVRNWQFQAWDLIAGIAEPALGGGPQWLDLLGVNHYHSSQWEVGTEHRLNWHGRDRRWRPLSALLAEAWLRYRRPLVVAETSHVGVGRGQWLHEVASELEQARRVGLPVEGLCLYPLVDRHDWNDTPRWHRSGLWHVSTAATGQAPASAGQAVERVPAAASRASPPALALPRVIDADAASALQQWQRVLPGAPLPRQPGQPVLSGHCVQPATPPLLAFSHLRWDFVRHRTRQLLGRLALQRRVVVVEEPLQDDGPPWLDCIVHGPSLQVLVPHTPLPPGGFDAAQQLLVEPLLKDWLRAQAVRAPSAWLCTPMAWPLARSLRPGRVVYDCADHLAGFVGAAPELPACETDLLLHADAVFAASTGIATALAPTVGARLRLLENGVSASHFAPQHCVPFSWEADEALPLQADLPAGPQLGYIGVVDDRLDLDLLAAVAAARPGWQWVMVGPVVKIHPATLPRGPNLHWLGLQHYRLLPHLMRHWRAGLLPFRLNGATRPSRPLKLLEYLAAGLPVVATPLPQLQGWQDAGVHPVATAPAFVAACQALLDETAAQAQLRLAVAQSRLADCGWDGVATAAQAVLARLESTTGAPAPSLLDQAVLERVVGEVAVGVESHLLHDPRAVG